MKYVLVICRPVNYRSLWIDNLVARGCLAVGVASLPEARHLVETITPGLVVLCQISQIDAGVIDELETTEALADVPRILVSPERPSSSWQSQHAYSYLSSNEDITTLANWVKDYQL